MQNDVNFLGQVLLLAIKNGWNQQLLEDSWAIHSGELDGQLIFCVPRPAAETVTHLDIRVIFFSHDFAAAIWGSEPPNYYCQVNGLQQWQYHLQQLVIDPKPIDYLRRHLKLQKAEV